MDVPLKKQLSVLRAFACPVASADGTGAVQKMELVQLVKDVPHIFSEQLV